MSGITAVRSRLREALDGLPPELPVFEVKPTTLTPPAVVLVPADPWLAPAPNQPHGIYTVNYQVLILNPLGLDNEHVITEVEERVNLVLDALDSPDHSWLVSEVSAPDSLEIYGNTFLTVRVAVSVPVKLT